MSDIQLNMRVSEEVAERFRAFCREQGISQPQGMDSLLSMMELVQVKDAMPARQTEIEGFEMHIKAVMDAFVYSLSINAEAEERAKQQFISSLESKDKTIIKLQEEVEKLQVRLAEAQKTEQESENRATEAEIKAAAASDAAVVAQQSAEDKAAIVDMLTVKLSEAERKLGDYDSLKTAAQAAQEQVNELQAQLKEMEYIHKAKVMELEYKAVQEKVVAQEEIAKEREQMERNHSAEIKVLYEKMSAYQEQIVALTKEGKTERRVTKSKTVAKAVEPK